MLRITLLVATLTLALSPVQASLVVGDPAPASLSDRQKQVAINPAIRSATNCVADVVSRDSRFGTEKLTALITDSIQYCVAEVHGMMNTIDHYFGDGAGHAFFEIFLDSLPEAVERRTKNASH
jgi:hypothetical protein